MAAVITPSPKLPKPVLVRRTTPDSSQRLRRGVQLTFLLLNVWLGIQFWLFVRQFEGGGFSGWTRPAGIEGWLPIAGMMNSKYFVLTGEVPRLHPAAMVLFATFVGLSLFMRKAFCGWLCPVGTFSEYLWKLGRETFRRTWALPKWVDIPLRSLKYVLAGLFVWAVGTMTVESIAAFLYSPYGIVADVKMLNFFRHLSVGGAITLAVLVVASVFVKNFWCRYLCPYGAVMGLASLLSPVRIWRNKERCIDCGKCAKACPSLLPVDQLVQIRSAECLGCMECIAVCPAESALGIGVSPRRWFRAPVYAAVIVAIFLGAVGVAKVTGHWDSAIPRQMYERLIPQASEYGHP
jgi:polyferredoxin